MEHISLLFDLNYKLLMEASLLALAKSILLLLLLLLLLSEY